MWAHNASHAWLSRVSEGEPHLPLPHLPLRIDCRAGRERVQSAGRARKQGSRFVELLERRPDELALARKARQEQANMQAALRTLREMNL